VIGRRVSAAALSGHGLGHLSGVALLWRWGQPGALRYTDMSPVPGTGAGIAVGGLWLVGAVLFVLAAVSLLAGWNRWYRIMAAAVVVSCAALLPSASMPVAAVGLVVDWLLLVVVLVVGARAATAQASTARAATAQGLPPSRY